MGEKADANATPKGVGGGEKASVAASGDTKEKEVKKEKDADGEDKKEPEPPEPTEEILSNPCRVLKTQMQYISFPKEIDSQPVRYTPLLGSRHVGFVLLSDSKPEEPEDLFLEEDKSSAADEKEPDPPAPFEWADA